MITFDAPFVLWLAPVVAAAVWLGAAWARRVRLRRAALWSEQTAALARNAGRGGPSALAVAACLGTVALAGPRWGQEAVVTETRGLNLAIAVDISRSMLAEDASPSRLGRAARKRGAWSRTWTAIGWDSWRSPGRAISCPPCRWTGRR